MELPWNASKALSFIVLTHKRGLKRSTIDVYLRRVRALHKEKNLKPCWSADDVRMALSGAMNTYVMPPGDVVRNRVPITPYHLKRIKIELAKTNWSLQTKRLLWCFCTWAYVGAFRSSDILATQTQAFREGSTLLWCHLEWREEILKGKKIKYLVVNIPEPKELPGKNTSVRVELLPNGSFACPVVALQNYMKDAVTLGPNLPVFADKHSLLTGQKVNSLLRLLLGKYVDYAREQVLGHSFRAGITSALARMGASKEVNLISRRSFVCSFVSVL